MPKISWVGEITCAGQKVAGVYKYDEDTIFFNLGTIDRYIEMKLAWGVTTSMILTEFFHEFKHYIDFKAYGLTPAEYIANPEKYQREAKSYAKDIMKRRLGIII